MRSSGVLQLDEALGRARTESGRHYELGRRAEPSELNDLEAQAAFRLLVECPDESTDEAHLLGAWLTSCKVARWLALAPPHGDRNEVERFLAIHGEAYQLRRQAGSPIRRHNGTF